MPILNEEDFTKLNILCFKIIPNNKSIELDKVMFGCAMKYILLGQEGKAGQGDINEGLIAKYKLDNPIGKERVQKYIDKFGEDQLYIRTNNGFIEIRRKSSLCKPMACFFSITRDVSGLLPSAPTVTKDIMIQGKISEKLFSDFLIDKATPIRIKDFNIINYLNERSIYNCVVNALATYGVNQNEICIRNVIYKRQANSEWECPEYIDCDLNVLSPVELFYKDSTFCHQEEKRIVVCSEKFVMNCCDNYDAKKNQFISNCFNKFSEFVNIQQQSLYNKHSEEIILEDDLTFRVNFDAILLETILNFV